MVYKFLNLGKPLEVIWLRLDVTVGFAKPSAIAIVFLATINPGASSTEYVFTAPPEVNRQIVEIPASKTDYPLYECKSGTVAKSETSTKASEAQEAEDIMDIHDSNCTDCENTLEETELDSTEQP
jgi:hypothetical protein